MDAHCIAPNLWQGSAPVPGMGPRREGFDVIVFCAEEFQPPASLYPGVKAIHAPNDDDSSRRVTPRELEIARKASKLVAAHVMAGDKVLVTCMAGRNRSGLVTAFTLMRLYGMTGREAMQQVKSRRWHVTGPALTNPQFVRLLNQASMGSRAA